MNKFSTRKQYLESSIITFIAAFSGAVAPSIGDLQFNRAAIIPLAFVGLRAGVKVLFELFATIKATPIDE